METLKKFQLSIAIFLGVVGIVSTIFAFDGRYAKEDSVAMMEAEIQKVEQRLDFKILEDRSYTLQERIWRYEDRYEGREMSEDAKEILRELRLELAQVEQDIRALKTVGIEQ